MGQCAAVKATRQLYVGHVSQRYALCLHTCCCCDVHCRGAKNVSVLGGGDKRNYTANMACSADGDVLPAQVVFEGKKKVPAKPSLIKYPDLKKWVYSLSPNHWATVRTMMRYTKDLLVPYLQEVGCLYR